MTQRSHFFAAVCAICVLGALSLAPASRSAAIGDSSFNPNELFKRIVTDQDEAAAASGSAEAQVRLGYGYLTGRAGEMSIAKSQPYLNAAIQQGSQAAAALLGYEYCVDKTATPQLRSQGIQLVQAAAQTNDPVAVTMLAELYRNGCLGQRDLSKAQALLHQVRSSFALARTYLGELCEDKSFGTPDYATARKYFTQAAAQGETRAMLRLGDLYLLGLGVPTDSNNAFGWVKLAAGLGDIVAKYRLARLYYGGLGTRRDPHTAFTLSLISAQGAYPPAELAAGNAYSLGDGVAQDFAQAYKWLCLAAASYQPAQAPLATLVSKMTPEQFAAAKAASSQKLSVR